MAVIAPFRGIVYNPEVVGDLSKVVTPPYDVISPVQQDEFYARDPHNMIRLILNKRRPDDTPENNHNTRSAAHLRRWLEEGVFITDQREALYYYEIDFQLPDGELKTREGFVCLLKLEDFDKGIVRPHEKTFARTRSERIELMLHNHANLSQVYAVYTDPENLVAGEMNAALDHDMVMDFEDVDRVYHRMWRVTDPEAIGRVAGLMAPKEIFIADGHHRYETSLAFRDIIREKNPGLNEAAPFEYLMIYLSNMDHPGLTILPTHRMLKSVDGRDPQSFIEKARSYFEVGEIPARGQHSRVNFAAQLKSLGAKAPTFGYYSTGMESYHLLTLKNVAAMAGVRPDLPETLLEMDVVVLDELILKHLMGVDSSVLGDEERIWFSHDASSALTKVESGEYEMVFLINPTRIDQVRRVAEASLIMPHKATYFYPKVINGSVLYDMGAAKEVARPKIP